MHEKYHVYPNLADKLLIRDDFIESKWYFKLEANGSYYKLSMIFAIIYYFVFRSQYTSILPWINYTFENSLYIKYHYIYFNMKTWSVCWKILSCCLIVCFKLLICFIPSVIFVQNYISYSFWKSSFHSQKKSLTESKRILSEYQAFHISVSYKNSYFIINVCSWLIIHVDYLLVSMSESSKTDLSIPTVLFYES